MIRTFLAVALPYIYTYDSNQISYLGDPSSHVSDVTANSSYTSKISTSSKPFVNFDWVGTSFLQLNL